MSWLDDMEARDPAYNGRRAELNAVKLGREARSLEQEFDAHLEGLVREWQEVGIDPDDMLKCATCHGWLFDPENNFEPVPHPNCPKWPTEGEPAMAKHVSQIVLSDDSTLEEHILVGIGWHDEDKNMHIRAMNPREIVEAVSQIDGEDLCDVIRGLQEAFDAKLTSEHTAQDQHLDGAAPQEDL